MCIKSLCMCIQRLWMENFYRSVRNFINLKKGNLYG